jgi:G3E family GTPase
MNEVGGADVDSLSLCPGNRADDIKVEAILHGSMCCDCYDAANESLRHLLSEVRGAPVFIETTGLACTGQVIDSVRRALAPMRSGVPVGYLASSIVVVDTPRFEAVMNTWSEAVNHLRDCETIILNKVEGAELREIEHAESQVRKINPRARIIKTSFADVEADDLTRRSASRRSKEPVNEAVQTTVDFTPAFRSLTVDVLYPIDLARVEDLFNRYRVSVLRAKGLVHSLSARQMQEIQWVPGSFTVQPYQHDKPVHPHIVMIGRRVPWQRVFEQLDACVLSPTPYPQN